MRHRYVVLAFSVVSAALVAVPAIGSQSTDPTATGAKSAKQIAKKARKKAKKALNKARNAQDAADAAQSAADAAQATAANSLQKPVRQVEAVSAETNGVGQFRFVTASCPTGERAIGGGGSWTQLNGATTGFNVLIGTRPVPAGSGTDTITGWQAYGITDHAVARVLRAYAVCVPE